MKPVCNFRQSLTANRKEIALVLPILLSLVLFSFLMRYRGWRSTPLGNADMLVYYVGAESMLHDGTMMAKGDITSYGSFPPPGTVYLVLPAVAWLRDPRLFSLPGDLLVNLATMFFLYMIFRQCAGRGLALAICVVFGFSRLIFMGIWPIGHPAYALGMLWFLIQWVRHRSPWWLFGALVIGAFGLYVDLAILPFLFVFPAVWLIFRPPIRLLPIAAACAIGLLIWYPYLHFETARGFADLRSIFSLTPVAGSGPVAAKTPEYCYASLPGEMDSINETYIPFLGNGQGMDRVVFSEPGLEKYHTLCVWLTNLDRNFDGGYFLFTNPAVSAALWFFFFVGLFQSIGMILPHGEARPGFLDRWKRINPKVILGICLMGSLAMFVALNPELLARFSADGKLSQPTRLVAELLRYYGPLIFTACLVGIFIGWRAPKRPLEDIAPFLIVWIPWLVLVIIAERTRSERFFWIWPFQVATMVFGAWGILEAISKKAQWKIAAVLGLAVLVFPLSFYLPHINGWIAGGYSGTDNPQIQVVDYIHHELAANGDKQVAIGYDYLSSSGGGPVQPQDTRMRYGSWFDLLLEARWGIRNLNQNPAGLADGDAWRVLEMETLTDPVPTPWPGYTPVAVFGSFVVYKAAGTTALGWDSLFVADSNLPPIRQTDWGNLSSRYLLFSFLLFSRGKR
jgi:hypothetical protein